MSDKTTITVCREAALKIGKLARERGLSLLKVASEALDLAAEVVIDGKTPAEVIPLVKLHKVAPVFDMVYMPLGIVAEILKDADAYLIQFYDYGRDLGAALSRELKLSELLKNGDMLRSLIPARRVEFQRGALVVMLPPRSGKLAHLFASFLRGLLDGFGCTRHTVSTSSNLIEANVSECISSEG
ncbi:hypothetical protein [Pyrobaculum calidifontis]|uniref:Uncharacterized protein n=1 Tax=Pyrobaculum calidifontis (strain DSM 21063 / JCM 11548 / VA1) TaxID=410359 RepID=A3MWJ9_PYRCJ|nr:hypothetical protein [Pyrobaculum calidifontis]ABO09016.1 conserved hypothetical protein [Pyrobaculum calidifontis JCM 11548]